MKIVNKTILLWASILLLGSPQAAWAANDFAGVNALSQNDFASFAKDLSAALATRNFSSASADGIFGFDVALDVSSTQPHNQAVFKRANQGTATLVLPRINVRKGLPFGIDVGASAAKLGSATLLAVEGRIALLDDSLLLPVLSARVSTSQLTQAEHLSFTSNQIELLASKTFINITPYGGVGLVTSQVGAKAAGLATVHNSQNKIFAGVHIGLGFVGLGVYVDRVGSTTSQGVRFSLGF